MGGRPHPCQASSIVKVGQKKEKKKRKERKEKKRKEKPVSMGYLAQELLRRSAETSRRGCVKHRNQDFVEGGFNLLQSAQRMDSIARLPRMSGSAAVWHPKWPLAHLPSSSFCRLGAVESGAGGHQCDLTRPKEWPQWSVVQSPGRICFQDRRCFLFGQPRQSIPLSLAFGEGREEVGNNEACQSVGHLRGSGCRDDSQWLTAPAAKERWNMRAPCLMLLM